MFFRKKNNKQNTAAMNNIITRAERLYESKNVDGLKDLQRTIWRSYQSQRMLLPYLVEDHLVGSSGELLRFVNGSLFAQCRKDIVETYISLSESVVTYPWHPDRIIDNLGTIGKGLRAGEFVPEINHRICYVHPLMLAEVECGNHSIAQGIIRGEGKAKITNFFDLTPVLEKYRCTGKYWICTQTDQIVGKCTVVEVGYAWEVGKFLSKCSVLPFEILSDS